MLSYSLLNQSQTTTNTNDCDDDLDDDLGDDLDDETLMENMNRDGRDGFQFWSDALEIKLPHEYGNEDTDDYTCDTFDDDLSEFSASGGHFFI